MKYSVEFNKLVKKSIENNQYIGLGNPNAKILFVGKEVGISANSVVTYGSAKSWLNKDEDYSARFIPKDNIKNFRHTWQKYQKLYDLILENTQIESDKKEYEITFVENVFATELSNLAAPTTNKAKQLDGFKVELDKRKELFWKSDYINNFSVIVITASDNAYIETYQGEVCKIFDVKFDKEVLYSRSNKMWLHYSNNKTPKLVIHTRQLTNGASNKLMEGIANEITLFLKKNNINIIVT